MTDVCELCCNEECLSGLCNCINICAWAHFIYTCDCDCDQHLTSDSKTRKYQQIKTDVPPKYYMNRDITLKF